MSLSTIITDGAIEDFIEIVDRYEKLPVKLGDSVRLAIRETIDRIVEFPEIYGRVVKQIRVGSVDTYPYLVYYALRPNSIVILAVLHNRQDYKSVVRRLREFDKHSPN
jgi:plasmid stabilization system protein ParE